MGRQGGDEFIVLLNDISLDDDVVLVVLKIRDVLSAPFNIRGEDVHINAGIGIAVYPRDGTNFETLIKHSDIAMYRAKKAADLQYQIFAESTTKPAKGR